MLGWELPPHNSGGLGVACLQLAKALAGSGADIDFVLPYSSAQKYEFMRVTAAHPKHIEEVETVKFESGAYDSHKYVLKGGREVNVNIVNQQQAYELGVANFIKNQQFDIIHAHDWLTFRAAIKAKQSLNRPLIVHIHSIERDRAGGKAGNPLVREIEAMTMLLADKVIAVSERVKKSIVEDYAIPASKIDVVHNSVDRSYMEPLDEQNAYKYLTNLKANGWKVVVNIGRLTIQKGLYHFIRTAAQVIEHNPKTIFLIVGSGEQRDELLELTAELGIADKVIFAGFQRGKNWRDAYAIGDIFVMPSVSEPFGLTPLEAIGYGTPVLISNQSGVAEVLRNCLKADYWDEQKMTNQIVNALKNESLTQELHANAWREYERMSWNDAADKLMDIYRHHREVITV